MSTFFTTFSQQKKIDLKEHLINELEDRRRNIENEGLSLDLNGGE